MSKFDQFIGYLNVNYNSTIDAENNGIFSRKDNERCKIDFTIEHETDEDTRKPYRRLKINLFQCLPPIGTASAGVPRSGGVGREMMLHFLMFIHVKFPDIKIVFLEAEAYADKKNMTEEQYYEYEEKLDKHQEKLEGYYNSLGLKFDDDWFEGYIGHIIDSIKNYDKMKSFNSVIKPKSERKMLEDFGITTTRSKRKNRDNDIVDRPIKKGGKKRGKTVKKRGKMPRKNNKLS